ncbi:molecular chaperone, partial [Thermodesulfobacteriota bacterium]
MSTATTVNMAEVYRFLSLSMQYPDRHWLNDDYLSLLSAFLEQLGWDEERTAIHSLTPFSATSIDALQVDHTRLFINSVPHVLAPPYGSYYLDSGGILYGATTEKTRTYYDRHGFELAVAVDIPDSLNLELQFLSFLHEQGQAEAEEEF